MKKKTIIIIISLCVVVIGYFVVSAALNTPTEASGVGVTTMLLKKADLTKAVNTTGIVQSEETTKITTDLTSSVVEIKVSAGDKVSKGDVLCILDDTAIKAEIASVEAEIDKSDKSARQQNSINKRNLNNAKADQTLQLEKANRSVQEAQGNVDKANKDLSDNRNSLEAFITNLAEAISTLDAIEADTGAEDYENKVAAQKELVDQLESEKAAAEEAVALSGSNLAAAQAALAEANDSVKLTQTETDRQIQSAKDAVNTAKTQSTHPTQDAQLNALYASLDKTVVCASVDGTVTSIAAEENYPVNGGTIMVIENIDAKTVAAEITENDVLDVKAGMKAILTSSALQEKEYTATVSKVLNVPMPASSEVSAYGESTKSSAYLAELTFDDADENILLGMHIKVNIILEESKNTFAVPYEAILTDENGISNIFAAIPDGNGYYIAKSIEIQEGIETDYYQAISGEGLEENMLIITTGDVKDGQQITLIDNTGIDG